ncbi:Kynurenine formamidase [Geranomyces michiganensis]|nr:Kynurenine formamidase [Geranomyces michiganensis]
MTMPSATTQDRGQEEVQCCDGGTVEKLQSGRPLRNTIVVNGDWPRPDHSTLSGHSVAPASEFSGPPGTHTLVDTLDGLSVIKPPETFFYTSERDEARSLDLHLPPAAALDVGDGSSDNGADAADLVVFAHGGAWRTEDKRDHAELAARLVRSTRVPCAVINYRLSTKAADGPRHPAHTQDLASALRALTMGLLAPCQSLDAATVPPKPFRKLVLVGHSCGAHMIAFLVMNPDVALSHIPAAEQTGILASIHGAVLAEGLYDLPAVVAELEALGDVFDFDPYFVRQAFGHDRNTWKNNSPSFMSITATTLLVPRILVVHGMEDELVHPDQAKNYLRHLWSIAPSLQSRIRFLPDVPGTHWAILASSEFTHAVAQFVAGKAVGMSGPFADELFRRIES